MKAFRKISLIGVVVVVAAIFFLIQNPTSSREASSLASGELQEKLVKVSEEVSKAVVSIRIAKKLGVFDLYDFRYHELEIPFLGSGVIIDEKGYVLTNDHVMVEGAHEIQVVLSDGREFKGVVAGRDKVLDLAMVKLQGVGDEKLPAARLGNSDKVKVGQMVLAMGNPYGSANYLDSPQPTITLGIVSALDRYFASPDKVYGGLIQTDAAINQGNSGGPLVNINGEVIAINVAIFTTSRGSEGIGFAIPINKAKSRLSQLKKGEKIKHGYLGIGPVTINKHVAKKLGLKYVRGVLVYRVEPDQAAAKAGIKEKDIITTIGKKRIVNRNQLIHLIKCTEPGATLNITVVRNGKKKTISVTIGEFPYEQ